MMTSLYHAAQDAATKEMMGQIYKKAKTVAKEGARRASDFGFKKVDEWISRASFPTTYGRAGGRNRRKQMTRKRPAKLLKKCGKVKRPNRKFKRKVDAVINDDAPIGTVHVQHAGVKAFNPINQQQVITNISESNVESDGSDMNEFTWQRVFDAVRTIYWNGTATESSGNVGQVNAFGGTAPDADGKFHVVKQHVRYKLTNNSNQGYTIKMLTCFPLTNGDEMPRDVWQRAIDTAYPGSNLKVFGTSATATIHHKGDMPTNYPLFNQKFKTDVTTFKLNPTQSKSFIRYGGCNVTYDYAYSRNNNATNVFLAAQKYKSQHIMFIVVANTHPITLRTSGALTFTAGSRVAANNVNAVFEGGLLIERQYLIKVRCPEEVPVAEKENRLARLYWHNTTNDQDTGSAPATDGRLTVQCRPMDIQNVNT